MTSSCPYCFAPFDARTIAFRCIADPRTCAPVEDLALQEFLHEARPRPRSAVTIRRVRRFASLPTRWPCDHCGTPTTKVVCTRCHNELPSQFRGGAARSVALVGAKAAGKSHFVAVLVNELESTWHARFGATLGAADDRTITRYRDIRRRLYDDGLTLQATPTVISNPELRYPLAFQLRSGAGQKRHDVLNLVFYDSAGEDLGDAELLERDARYVTASDAVLAILDPLQLPSVRRQLDGRLDLPDQGPDPLELLTRITLGVRARLGLKAEARVDLPLGLVFAKLDAVRALMDQESPALRESPHAGAYREDDGVAVSESIRAHIHQWAGPRLDNFVQEHWSAARWFGVSALGRAPQGTALTKGVSPVRVDEPLLWLASRWGTVRMEGGGR